MATSLLFCKNHVSDLYRQDKHALNFIAHLYFGTVDHLSSFGDRNCQKRRLSFPIKLNDFRDKKERW